MIQCGSSSVTPTQQRYATIELECMAIKWAIHKCAFYLLGLPTFQVWTDHRPLVGIFQKDLPDIDNCKHELASAHNPESNWLAEAAVKNMKSLVTRTHTAKENLTEAIAAWRNMARSDGKSPSQIFFGRRQKHALPLTLDLVKPDTTDNKAGSKDTKMR